MVRTSLLPGFRFHPTDVELIMYYLKRKVVGKKFRFETISELNIYKFAPWDLPGKSCLKSKDLEWFFFCPREKKYASGVRMNRATETGYWKTTGKDRSVVYNNNSVGMIKTLVFHQGCAPRGLRTDWVIHEYRIEDKKLADMGVAQDTYVLCKVFHKNGPGPKNGAQYGAHFKEEDWDHDEEIPVDSSSHDAPSSLGLVLPENENTSVVNRKVDLGNASALFLNEPGPSFVRPSRDEAILDGWNSSVSTSMVDPGNASGLSSARHSGDDMNLYTSDDNILHLLAAFSSDSPLLPTGHGNNELGDLDQGRATDVIPQSDGSDLFNGLGDLTNLDELNGCGLNFLDTGDVGCTAHNMLRQDDGAFLELNDLDVPLNFNAELIGAGQQQTGGGSAIGSEQLLTGRLCTHYNTSRGFNQFRNDGNFPGFDPCLTDLHQLSVLPDSSEREGNSTNVFQMANVYESTNAAYNLDFTPYRQQEEIRNAARNQERGVQQRILFSRLQQLLESIPADPASAAYDGSSIHVKAEVTYRFSTCTKDALSVVLGESTFVYSCWWNLPGLKFEKTVGYCSMGSAVVFYLTSDLMCIQMILLLIELGWYLWNWFSFCDLIGCFKRILDFVLIIR